MYGGEYKYFSNPYVQGTTIPCDTCCSEAYCLHVHVHCTCKYTHMQLLCIYTFCSTHRYVCSYTSIFLLDLLRRNVDVPEKKYLMARGVVTEMQSNMGIYTCKCTHNIMHFLFYQHVDSHTHVGLQSYNVPVTQGMILPCTCTCIQGLLCYLSIHLNHHSLLSVSSCFDF